MDLYNEEREYFLTFLSRTTQKKNTVKHLQKFLPQYSPQTTKAIKQGKKVKFLDIGAGTGKVSFPFLNSFGNVEYTIREPNLGMAVNLFFNYLIEDLPFQNLKIDPRTSTDYGKEKYDFVLASHSFYYLSDWEETIHAVYDSLVLGGAACIIIGSEKSDLVQLRRKFFPKLHRTKPRTAEELTDILNKIDMKYYQNTISSVINTKPINQDDITALRALRENGILMPSLDSLYSFLLWQNFNELSNDMQKEVQEFVNQRDEFKLIDSAIWITKPGNYDKWENINPAYSIVTIGDFIKLFKPMLEDNFGEDIKALTPRLKEAYYNLLALDCVLSHPMSKLSFFIYRSNSDRDYDDYFHIFRPKKDMGVRDYIIFDPNEKRKFKDLPAYCDDEYILLYGHCGDIIPYFFDFVESEYKNLPAKDKKGMSEIDFHILILNLFKKFNHKSIFSNRFDGSTQIGLIANSSYVNITPQELTPELANIYKQMGIKFSQPSPIKA